MRWPTPGQLAATARRVLLVVPA